MNPLQMGGPPDAPNPNAQDNAQQQAPQGVPQQPPAPNHAETVAALRHFHAIADGIQTLLKDPKLGRSDVKSDIIDGVTKMVSERLMSPAQAVIQLASVPDDPLQQRKWLQQHFMQAKQAEINVLDQHRMSHVGSGDWQTESAHPQYNPDDHMGMMGSLMTHYKGPQRG